MSNIKVGDKVRSVFPYSMDESERFYRFTHGMVGEVIKVGSIFVRVRFDGPILDYPEGSSALFFSHEVEVIPNESIPAVELEIGQIARIVSDKNYSGQHVGDVILRTYNNFVSLRDPLNTWDFNVTFSVIPFNKGETFEVISK